MADPRHDPRSRMHSGYQLLYLVPFLVIGLVEIVGISRPGTGDTVSEHIWKLVLGWWGAPIFALLYWLALYHLPVGRWRPLGWLDAAAACVGLVVWWFARARYLGGV